MASDRPGKIPPAEQLPYCECGFSRGETTACTCLWIYRIDGSRAGEVAKYIPSHWRGYRDRRRDGRE